MSKLTIEKNLSAKNQN